jgi:hypothetical protein
VPDGGFATDGDLNSIALFTEPASTGLPEVWSLKR